jgi:hypothetical protein
MAPGLADGASRDAALLTACVAARTAVAALNAEAAKDEPGDVSALFDRERHALECVAATRARTPRGISEKALLLDACGESPEAATLAMSLAEDAVALVREMVGAGAIEL